MINRIKKILHPVYRRFILYPPIRRIYQERIRKIREKGSATVVFLVSSLAMWKLQSLYNRFAQDERIKPYIFLIPFQQFCEEEKNACMQELRDYLTSRDIPYYDSLAIEQPEHFYREVLDPDIVFYPQPYEILYGNYADFPNNTQRLSVYMPYSALTIVSLWAFDTSVGHFGWRNYFDTWENARKARHFSWCGGRNVKAPGFILGDLLSTPGGEDVWKPQEHRKKRIIWAPHFSGINPNGWLKRGSFLWMADLMQNIAVQYRDALQIAFKPHPRLLTELFSAPGWGAEKAKAYYAWWNNQANTQLETGQYIDLFKSSDAMIHDSGSFTIDYLYTRKPVLFASSNLEETVATLNNLGKEALSVHEIGKNPDDIRNFIFRVLQDASDPKADEKEKFLTSRLQVKEGESVADRIYKDILKSIRFKR